jgi:hypothetical protein
MMRSMLAAAILMAFSNACLGAGLSDGEFPVADILALICGQSGEDDEIPSDWGEQEEPDFEEGPAPGPAAPGPGGGIRLQGGLGGIVPFISKKADYTGGFDLGFGVKIGLNRPFPSWVRPYLDVGFISADGNQWETSSTLLLFHFDVGYNFLNQDAVHGSVFGGAGLAIEMLSGEEGVAGGGTRDVSETNANLLSSIGATLGFAATDMLDIDLNLRLTIPVGSRNVQGILLIGVSASLTF